MFDIGFAELLIIAVLGLLVLGPERLPGAIRTVSLWIGRLKRSFADIRREIEREVGADEIRQQLHNESVMSSLKESEQKLRSSVDNAKQEFKTLEHKANDSLKENTVAPPQYDPLEENTVAPPPKPASKDETP
ncbi:twin arginine-targeting protein translocase TatB [Spongiibacter sp. IMCC21906]|jgi:sec-independent protein translocase protein TatB|uniref:Sec-independent protein translocase protein TatB n=1 Tax=Spongiibacter sp. IMCC21906 TaxID=1620392 RepID=UPI00062DEEE1|nr:Sec-independent protein translocase protein TatB [Spongiibacter sp. IMCC21906]AKH70516.1 twin arginine-targeting protein translocase TatB [Spongiibacter sp. IMCC21906]